MWKKYVFILFTTTMKLIAIFFSHNLHDLYLTNNIQRCGGLKCEYYIGDFIIYIQVISKLKCGYTALLKIMSPQPIISSVFEYSFKH